MPSREGKTPHSPLWRRGPLPVDAQTEEPEVEYPRPPRKRAGHTPLPAEPDTPTDDTDNETSAEPQVLAPTAEPRPAPPAKAAKPRGPQLSEELATARAQQLASTMVDMVMGEMEEMLLSWRKDIALTGAAMKAAALVMDYATGGAKGQVRKGKTKGNGNAGKEMQDFLSRARAANPPKTKDNQPEGDD